MAVVARGSFDQWDSRSNFVSRFSLLLAMSSKYHGPRVEQVMRSCWCEVEEDLSRGDIQSLKVIQRSRSR